MSKILVIDDDEGILESLDILLQTEGFTVRTSPDGKQTVRLAVSFQPDIILLDILLSGMDGRDVAVELKKNPETKHIPIIMISAHPTAAQSVKKIGAVAFISKPFGIEKLRETLQKYIR